MSEAGFTWTTDVSDPLGTVVTIQPGTLTVSRGSAVRMGGGVSASGKTCCAFVGTTGDPGVGDLGAETFLASLDTGGQRPGTAPLR